MKRFLLFFFLICCVAVQGQQVENFVKKLGKPTKLVSDFANVLTPEQEAALEQKLVAYDDSTSNQVAVVTVPTLGDLDVNEVALEILRQWGVGGQANKDNGIVLLAAIQDRRISIQTGYGLEGAVPDVTAKNIIENDIVPAFRSENYYRGFDAASSSIMRAAAGEYSAPVNYRKRNSGGGLSIGKIVIAVIIIFILLNMFSGGGGGGGYVSRRGYRGFGGPIFLPGPFGGGGGGGFGGGFGGGGGGFGGFGGGSGGGGGASGSW